MKVYEKIERYVACDSCSQITDNIRSFWHFSISYHENRERRYLQYAERIEKGTCYRCGKTAEQENKELNEQLKQVK